MRASFEVEEQNKPDFDILFDNELIEEFTNENMFTLLNSWGNIRRIRNHSAHPELVEVDHFNQILSEFEMLVNTSILKRMMILKNRYKGKETI